MQLLTEDAQLACNHKKGILQQEVTQSFVMIQGRRILVEVNTEGRPIKGCPMYGPAIKPCTTSLRVQRGYSTLIRIGGRRVCLDTVTGLTDGTPPGAVYYQVLDPGQQWVRSGA